VATSIPKRIILCLDGTWASAYNEAERRDHDDAPYPLLKPSNPLKLCRAVVPFDDEPDQPGTRTITHRIQSSYYQIGVGGLDVFPGTSNLLLQRTDRFLGGAFGAGFEENVEAALAFLALNYKTGDEVFIFGFSRGAATARAVTRFLEWNGCQLPRKSDVYYLPILFRAFVDSRGAAHRRADMMIAIDRQRQIDGYPPLDASNVNDVKVKYLGIWDTVMALGSRFEATEHTTSSPGRSFYAGTQPSACVMYARHALAVDEHRFDFQPEIWTGYDRDKIQQRWFAGVHTNIGGGYRRDGLANIALHWVVDGAIEQGLKIDVNFLEHYPGRADGTMYDSYSVLYRTLDIIRGRIGSGKRRIPVDADIDRSVIDRMKLPAEKVGGKNEEGSSAAYRPQNVLEFLAEQPDVAAYLRRIGEPDGEDGLPDDVKRRIEELRHARRNSTPSH
jgi:uncharacterized protein (DUF2235 family)